MTTGLHTAATIGRCEQQRQSIGSAPSEVRPAQRYAWKFADQQADTTKWALQVGDYAVEADGTPVAVVERKSVEDLVSTIVGGKLWTLLAALGDVRHAAVGRRGPLLAPVQAATRTTFDRHDTVG